MTPRPDAQAPDGEVRRFTPGERWVHRGTAALMGVCVVTAACLYIPQLAVLVGRRDLVVRVHEYAGLALPAPFLLGLASRAFRADLRLLDRFGPHDKLWLRAALRRDRRRAVRPAGKFNAGQKVWASWIAGAALVMLGTGLLMWFTHLAPLRWRISATFVHDWLALTVGIVLAGHIGMAYNDPEARRGMRTGFVSRVWADSEHPLWRPRPEAPTPAARPHADAAGGPRGDDQT
ncbi:cytochrome b/b6 domain-containing protein [Streptomyces sp. NPDC046985]|uniref:cytochrome b/b6 domain-containing protein n=1 Tax=Streptomyces sp. NPDC046985 TaxID=3155377 RepID=UPI0033F07B6B